MSQFYEDSPEYRDQLTFACELANQLRAELEATRDERNAILKDYAEACKTIAEFRAELESTRAELFAVHETLKRCHECGAKLTEKARCRCGCPRTTHGARHGQWAECAGCECTQYEQTEAEP